MAKANIETKSGLKITIEGKSSEIVDIIGDLQYKEKQRDKKMEFIRIMSGLRGKRNNIAHRTSITDILTKLIKNGFFDKPKKFREVANRLGKEGIFSPSSTVHPLLFRLVAHGKLKRKRGDEDFWEYVKNG